MKEVFNSYTSLVYNEQLYNFPFFAVQHTQQNLGRAIQSCAIRLAKLGQGHPELCNTPTEKEKGLAKNGEVMEADARGQKESGGLFVLALRNKDVFDIPLNVFILNSNIWISCME